MLMNKLFIISAFFFFSLTGCKTSQMNQSISSYPIRLKPGEDLRTFIENFAKEKNIKAGWIVTCAGSLTDYSIRFANQQTGSTGKGHFEIVSLTGTVSVNGCHLHISISDSTGHIIGGHLLAGCKIYTTAEIVIQSDPSLIFTREKDGTTPWEELQIKNAE